MTLTRTAIRIAKPLWTSIRARYSSLPKIKHNPCCSIITGGESHKRGVFSIASLQNLEHEHDSFIGDWQEVENENYGKFLKAAGIKGDVDRLEKGMSWLSFERIDSFWFVSHGRYDSRTMQCFCFRFGEYFEDHFMAGRPTKGIIYPDTHTGMREIYETLTEPKLVMNVERKVNPSEKTLHTTLKLNDMVARRRYEKIRSH